MNEDINKNAIRNTWQKDIHVFDKEHVTKQMVYLKGVGRRCEVCKKHLFGRIDKKTCSNKCRSKMAREVKGNAQTNLMGVHAFISLRRYKEKK